MSDVDKIFDRAMEVSQIMNDLYEKKAEAIRQRRLKAQNNPSTKRRKSESMKRYWKARQDKEAEEREEQKARDSYVPESCYCHIGNPPCSWCTDTNYCEICDINTWNDECPKCGYKLIELTRE